MNTFVLNTKTHVNRPRAEVFDFFSKAENLKIITPDWLGFQIITPLPISMKKGTVIDYTIRVFGLRFHWQSEISQYNPPNEFADEQRKGPYAFWQHSHVFLEASGGTIVQDHIVYAMPCGFLGHLLHRFVVRRQIEKIFQYREKKIREIFDS